MFYYKVRKEEEKEEEVLGIKDEEFNRIKKKLYGEFVKSYNDANNIATSFVQNYFRNINPFDYFEEFKGLDKNYTMQVLKDVFQKEKQIVSIVKSK